MEYVHLASAHLPLLKETLASIDQIDPRQLTTQPRSLYARATVTMLLPHCHCGVRAAQSDTGADSGFGSTCTFTPQRVNILHGPSDEARMEAPAGAIPA